MTAMVCTLPRLIGRVLLSFLSRVMASSAALWAMSMCAWLFSIEFLADPTQAAWFAAPDEDDDELPAG